MTLPDLGYKYRWEPAIQPSNKTLLLLHGTGGTEDDLIDFGKLIAPEFNLLSPRGKVVENGLTRFFKRKPDGTFDVDDLKHKSIQLGDFILRSRAEFNLGNNPIVALGYSNGANIATGIIFQDADILQGAILLRPMVPYLPGKLNLKKVKILMVSGALDHTMPEEEPERLEKIYNSNHAAVTSYHLNSGHGLGTEDIKIAKNWIKNNF